MAAADDDEEELQDEGHYDVITRPRRPATGTEAKQAQLSKKQGNHPYETVTGDQDSDGTYAGIKEDNESAKLSYAGAGLSHNDAKSYSGVDIELIDPTYSGIQEEQSPTKGVGKHPYAVVDGVGDAQYAHIDKKQSTRHSSLIQQGHAAESMETLDGSYASVPPPPVPDKNFDAASENSELTSPPTGQMTSSPSLPPRNSIAAANGGGTVGNSLDSSQSSDGGGNIAASMAVAGNGSTTVGINGASLVIIGGPDVTGAASAAGMCISLLHTRIHVGNVHVT